MADGDWHLQTLCEQGFVGQEEGGRVISCKALFQKELVEVGGKLVIQDKATKERASAPVVSKAIEIKMIGAISCLAEVYHYRFAPTAPSGVYWVLRWMVDFIGGGKGKNFVGDSLLYWTNWVSFYDAMGCEADASSRLKRSAWSVCNQADTHGEATNGDIPFKADLEFSCTSFALVVLLGSWAGKGPHNSSKWHVAHSVVQKRCSDLLNGLLVHFVRESVCTTFETSIGALVIDIRFEANEKPRFDWEALVASPAGASLRRVVWHCESKVTVVEVLERMVVDEVSCNFSPARKMASRIVFAYTCFVFGSIVECSRGDEIWEESSLVQLTQVCLSRGYRRSSPAFKQSVVQTCAHRNIVRHVGPFLSQHLRSWRTRRQTWTLTTQAGTSRLSAILTFVLVSSTSTRPKASR